jgi:hypothetical protein
VDPHQIYTIIHCEFEFKCDLNWKNLNPTGGPMVRYCEQCKKNVLLCLDNEQIDHVWENGLCIAHPLYTEKGLKQIKDFEAGIGENPFFVEMPMELSSTR